MLTAELILKLFKALNEDLASVNITGEIGICGGAVMCLVFKARASTKDIDAIFAPTQEIRKASLNVAKKFGLADDWLNDAVKGFFLSDPPRENVLELSNLRIWAPKADYLLAMKCISARADTHDKEDIIFLLKHLKLSKPQEVFSIIIKYYPKSRIPSKTQFLIEELLD
ncbi:hypothetical protein ACFL6Y_04755 [Elusimicrobiota bacterium]